MRRAFIAFMGLAATLASPASPAEPIRGAGLTSCGTWAARTRPGIPPLDTFAWIQGYLSAYSEYAYQKNNKDGVFGDVDWQGIAAWMDNYCQKNPLSSPYDGMLDLIIELDKRQQK